MAIIGIPLIICESLFGHVLMIMSSKCLGGALGVIEGHVRKKKKKKEKQLMIYDMLLVDPGFIRESFLIVFEYLGTPMT